MFLHINSLGVIVLLGHVLSWSIVSAVEGSLRYPPQDAYRPIKSKAAQIAGSFTTPRPYLVLLSVIQDHVPSSFSCQGRPYGFYADVGNKCRAFHVCNPQWQPEEHKTIVNHYSFWCKNGTIFDQLSLVCRTSDSYLEDSCNSSYKYYDINRNFLTKVGWAIQPRKPFSCRGRPPGYYADINNACRMYYICLPYSKGGQGQLLQFEMNCPEHTIFDQSRLRCVLPDLSLPCEEAENVFQKSNGSSVSQPVQKEDKSILTITLSPHEDITDIPVGLNSRSGESIVGDDILSEETVIRSLGLRQTASIHVVVPSNGERLEEVPETNFSCDGREYGYYADVSLQCHVFHVCEIRVNSGGSLSTIRHSFHCPDGWVFDQLDFACDIVSRATPCKDAESLYFVNHKLNRI